MEEIPPKILPCTLGLYRDANTHLYCLPVKIRENLTLHQGVVPKCLRNPLRATMNTHVELRQRQQALP